MRAVETQLGGRLYNAGKDNLFRAKVFLRSIIVMLVGRHYWAIPVLRLLGWKTGNI